MSEWQNKPWEEVEELFGFRADDSLPLSCNKGQDRSLQVEGY